MKIVHSFWTQWTGVKNVAAMQANFASAKMHYYSWTISAMQAKKWYPDVELYTDTKGAEVLIEQLKLPYSKVHIVFDNCDVNGELFSYAKLKAYALQTEPFIHIDSDVFLWKKLPTRIETAQIAVQSYEKLGEYHGFQPAYVPAIRDIRHVGFERKLSMFTDPTYTMNTAYNCGIFGGTNIGAIHDYANEALDFVECPENQEYWGRIGIMPNRTKMINATLEQLFLTYKTVKNNIPVELLFENYPDLFKDEKVAELGFTHLMSSKTNLRSDNGLIKYTVALDAMKARVEREYPEQAAVINSWKWF